MMITMMETMETMDIPIEEGQPDPAEMFSPMMEMMKYMYLLVGIFNAIIAVIFIVTGVCMFRKKNRTLAIVGAGASCLLFPLGTALGIWALTVLFDEDVKIEFEATNEAEQFGNFV